MTSDLREMQSVIEVDDVRRRSVSEFDGEQPSFAREAAPNRWNASTILIAAGVLCVLFMLNSLFWIALKVAVVVAGLVWLARKYGGQTLAYTGSDILRMASNAPREVIAGGALLLIAYAFAGSAGFLVAAGVCVGVFVRARLIDWP